MKGELEEGSRLNERALCAELNVSRTPVREAFRMLQAQNVLTYNQYSGVSVKFVTQKFLDDVWVMRELLETYAVREAVRNLDESGIKALARFREAMSEPANENLEAFNELDNSFHLELAKLSKNEELVGFIESIWNSLLICRSRLFRKEKTIRDSYNEHIQVIDAILERDEKKAVTAWHYHLNMAMNEVRVT